MSRKRTLPDVYRSRKRVCAVPANHSGQEVLNTNGVDWNDGESSNHIGMMTSVIILWIFIIIVQVTKHHGMPYGVLLQKKQKCSMANITSQRLKI